MSETIITPDKLFPILQRYRAEAELVLDIDDDKAAGLADQGDNGVLSLDTTIRNMKDTLRYADASYFARIQEEGSIHHGWYFDPLAFVRGREIYLLEGLRFGASEDGLVSAFFASAILPTVGAFWHGLYERDYVPIESSEEFSGLLKGDTLKADGGQNEALLQIPIGLRIRDVSGTKRCRCLCLSETDGLMDVEVVVHPDGRADEATRTVLCEPANRVLY